MNTVLFEDHRQRRGRRTEQENVRVFFGFALERISLARLFRRTNERPSNSEHSDDSPSCHSIMIITKSHVYDGRKCGRSQFFFFFYFSFRSREYHTRTSFWSDILRRRSFVTEDFFRFFFFWFANVLKNLTASRLFRANIWEIHIILTRRHWRLLLIVQNFV